MFQLTSYHHVDPLCFLIYICKSANVGFFVKFTTVLNLINELIQFSEKKGIRKD
jgi:hypothetical protein